MAFKLINTLRKQFFEFLVERKAEPQVKILFVSEIEFGQEDQISFPNLYQIFQNVKKDKDWLEFDLTKRWFKSIFLRTEAAWVDIGGLEDGKNEIRTIKEGFKELWDRKEQEEEARLKASQRGRTEKFLDEIKSQKRWVAEARTIEEHRPRCPELRRLLTLGEEKLKKFTKNPIINTLSFPYLGKKDPKLARLEGCFIRFRQHQETSSRLESYPELKEGPVYLIIFEQVRSVATTSGKKPSLSTLL